MQSYKIKNTELNLNPVFSIYTKYFIVPLKTYSELTFSANYRPNTLINTTLSYSMLQGGETFGIAFKIGPLMLGTDYMYFGNNSKHVNAFIGLSIPLGKKI